jgi:RNA polymerase sigma-70 factor, ECF subfamily
MWSIDRRPAVAGFHNMPDPKRYDEFAGLVRLHTSQVLAYINALVLNWNDADDLFQETCLVLWEKFDEFRPGTNFLAWALRIANYKVMKFRTQQSRRVAFIARLRNALEAEFAGRSSDDAAAGFAALSGCMDRLTAGDRRMVTQCYGESTPVRQVAGTMGRSPESVHRSLRRIRKSLLDCIHRELRRADAPAPVQDDAFDEEDRP